jgi:hypothetical protein
MNMKYCLLFSACSASSWLGECISQEINPLIPISLYEIDTETYSLDCSTKYLEIAAKVAPDGHQFAGEYIGYPGGECGFVKH